ncbi:neuronal acetylcholine receptor subunit alpha-7-like [Entelurus aequoreus]|uniref:neuronal acetylcholine receptor subunit alpha-7-like n=1 Tax=Entelurus aequoreus TaxID=161455 RepID=UPI002B1E1508|nr:neuronal acetylcholine receptor subunit alpha-7-like [Entelurus aequoreus]
MDPHHVLLVLLVSATSVQVSLQGAHEARLYRQLMVDYNPLVRPVANESQTLMVKLGLHLVQIMNVDEKNQVFTTNIWFEMTWNDQMLQWDTSEFNGVSKLRFPDHLIWKPDVVLYNSADERFDATYHTKVLVSSSGECIYLAPAMFKSTCYIDVRWFPFDIQKCELKFGSWTYDGWSVNLTMSEADISGYVANGEWDLVEVTVKREDHIYPCCPEPYPDVKYTIVMRRRTLYYGLNLLIPCILISMLALLVFLLPADSGEKISLGITVLLALTVFMLIVAEIMPATSDSVPLIARYFVTTMVIVAFSIIATIVVLQFHHHDPDGARMPKWVRVFLLNWCAWFLLMKRPDEDKKIPQNSPTGIDTKAGVPSSTNDEDQTFLPKGQSYAADSGEPELVKILNEVRYIARRVRVQDDGKTAVNDWKFAAAVIDRLCFVIFSLVLILSTLSILMSAPNFHEAVSKDAFA